MPFAVEDGSGVANANSLASVQAVKDYASLRGATLPAADTAIQVLLVKATDYLKSLSFQGVKTYADTSTERYLPWPRSCLVVDGADWPEDVIPQDIADAACQLVIEQHVNSVNLAPTNTAAAIKREKTGPMETEWRESSRAPRPSMPAVDALLAGWIVKRGAFGLTVGRA